MTLIEQGRPRTPGPARANITSPELELVRPAEEKKALKRLAARQFDVDPDGDLVEPGRFLIFGWKTNSSEEEGTRVVVDTPSEAGIALTSLLRSGHVHFTASRLDLDGRVPFSDTP